MDICSVIQIYRIYISSDASFLPSTVPRRFIEPKKLWFGRWCSFPSVVLFRFNFPSFSVKNHRASNSGTAPLPRLWEFSQLWTMRMGTVLPRFGPSSWMSVKSCFKIMHPSKKRTCNEMVMKLRVIILSAESYWDVAKRVVECWILRVGIQVSMSFELWMSVDARWNFSSPQLQMVLPPQGNCCRSPGRLCTHLGCR